MIKRSIRHFCLSLSILGAVTLPAFDTAFAQSPADQKISNIEKAFETADIDVPEAVMSALKDVILEMEALTEDRDLLYHQRVFKGSMSNLRI